MSKMASVSPDLMTAPRTFSFVSVTLAASVINRSAVRGGYVIMKQLPERDGEFEYRIKSASETHERVARESDLARE
jgi:hypothetical protein